MSVIQTVTQCMLFALTAAAIYILWRAEVNDRAMRRIQAAQRRNIALHKAAIQRLIQANDKRAELDNEGES